MQVNVVQAHFLEAGDSQGSFTTQSDAFQDEVHKKIQALEHLEKNEKNQLLNLVLEFQDVFSDEPGCLRNYTCKLDVKDPNPKIRQTYPIPIHYREAVDREIENMLEMGIIERATSPYLNPIRITVKANGKIRLCLDARQLNKYLEADQEAPPLIDEIIQDHAGMKFFTTTDLSYGYNHIMLDHESRKYTAFSINGRVYQYCRLPFGIKISGSRFIAALNIKIPWWFRKFLKWYIDDMIARSRNFLEHLKHLKLFFELLRELGLKIKLSKTRFAQLEVPFVGFLISDKGVRPDPERIQAILSIPEPRTFKELQSLIGAFTYYRRFHEKYAYMLDEFRDIMSPKVVFKWSKKHHIAFEQLREQFSKEVLLSHYRIDKPFYLQTDGSKKGISGILYQTDKEGKRLIIGIVSRCLTKYEQNYTATEIELLAVVYSSMKLKMYLKGKPFYIISDHESLQFLLKMSYYTSRLLRWSLILQSFPYEIKHCKGKENILADYFSRINENEMYDFPVNNNVFCDAPIRIIAKIQAVDLWIPELRHISRHQKQDNAIRILLETENLNKKSNFLINHDILFYKATRENKWRIVVPSNLQNKLVSEAHEQFGHVGVHKTFSVLSGYFWWKNMRQMVKNHVAQCDLCQRVKYPNWYTHGPFLPVEATRPNQLVACDYFGPLPRSTGRVEYILVVFDVFSRLVTLYPIKKARTVPTINRMRQYIAEIGKPSRLLCDNGTQFQSDKWLDFLKEEGIEVIHCSKRHPASNPSERTMRELGRFFRSYCNEQHTLWAKYINFVNSCLNLTTHSTSGYTPYELHYGKSPKSKIKSLIRFPSEVQESHDIMIELANDRTRKAFRRRAKYQKTCKTPKFKIDDLVLLRVPHQSNALQKQIKKFFHLYYGPYRINKCFNDNAYELVEKENHKKIIGHYNRCDLKMYAKPKT